jgi:hypothetical protein
MIASRRSRRCGSQRVERPSRADGDGDTDDGVADDGDADDGDADDDADDGDCDGDCDGGDDGSAARSGCVVTLAA